MPCENSKSTFQRVPSISALIVQPESGKLTQKEQILGTSVLHRDDLALPSQRFLQLPCPPRATCPVAPREQGRPKPRHPEQHLEKDIS